MAKLQKEIRHKRFADWTEDNGKKIRSRKASKRQKVMSEKETCFVFYQRWYAQISLLPEQDQLQLFKAICEYVFCGTKAELNVYLEAIMVNIRIAIDKDKDKQEAFLKKQKEKSLKAIEARKRYIQQFSDNPTQPTGNPRVNSGNPTQPYNKNKNKNKNKEQEQEQEQEGNNLSIEHSSTSTQNVDADAATSDKVKKTPPSEEEKKKERFYHEVAERFNDAVKGKQIQAIKKLNSFRKSHIEARKTQYGKDAIFEVIEKASKSEFLNGCGRKGFVATFDWIIRPTNFLKVLEGNYDNKLIPTNNGTNDKQGTQANNGLLSDRQRRDIEFAKHAAELLKAADTTTEEVPKPLW